MSEVLSSVLGGNGGQTIFDMLKGFALSTLNMVLPYAIGIFCVFFCWLAIKDWFLKMVMPKVDYYKNYLGFYDNDIEVIDEEEEEDLSGNLRGYDDL